MRRPRIFIASSTEGIKYAHAVFSHLESVAEPVVWDQNIFVPSETTIESLENMLETVDYGMVVCTPDDIRIMRERTSSTPRDNVILELGMLIGRLGRKNVFILGPQGSENQYPSDLNGVNRLSYLIRTDHNYTASVATACHKVCDIIDGGSSAVSRNGRIAFWNNVHERHRAGVDLRSLLATTRSYVLISGIALNYPIISCRQQLISTLERQVTIEIMMPTLTESSRSRYEPFKSNADEEMRLSVARWTKFANELRPELSRCFRVFTTSMHLTHSVGLYDTRMYVNNYLCGLNSADLPSFRIDPDVPAYGAFLTDLKNHALSAELLAGNGDEFRIIQRADEWHDSGEFA